MRYALAIPGINDTVHFQDIEDGSLINNAEVARAFSEGTAQVFNSSEFLPIFDDDHDEDFDLLPENATIIQLPRSYTDEFFQTTVSKKYLN